MARCLNPECGEEFSRACTRGNPRQCFCSTACRRRAWALANPEQVSASNHARYMRRVHRAKADGKSAPNKSETLPNKSETLTVACCPSGDFRAGAQFTRRSIETDMTFRLGGVPIWPDGSTFSDQRGRVLEVRKGQLVVGK